MAQRVNLDAMIPREDFAIVSEDVIELELIRDFPISHLESDSAVLKLLRKPDFQRETNHWSPEQIATFITSFLDNEVIPSLILWKSPSSIFVIDGGHRLSALRAWMVDDYGDGSISREFYSGDISNEQKKIAARTRRLVEEQVGRYSALKSQVGKKANGDVIATNRASRLFTRPLNLQWIQGNASVAETSFFKINSQGTPLDDIEEMLIKNRRKPFAVAARAILRSGNGHEYWSQFSSSNKVKIRSLANELHRLLFNPESQIPLKTLDVPLGGSVSPVDALALLIDFLTIASCRTLEPISVDKYDDDKTGVQTINSMKRSLEVLKRITGNFPGSLGLHPAVYFYNERGKYSRFLFLGMILLVAKKVMSNDDEFFKKFISARVHVENFLIANKSIITLLLQNMSKKQRVPKMADMFDYLIHVASSSTGVSELGEKLALSNVASQIGLSGRVLDIGESQASASFNDETKSTIFINTFLPNLPKCSVCQGYLDPSKSVSYDHKIRRREGGRGTVANGQIVHPYCNTGIKS
ncbi:DUF262 domain-containing protein [Pseudomonas piscis]|uniref:GmrSD restriction endonuclease domain-containing protein n=1 Tax=Pseudomonas piscis TaxID=2614538 RepID=UPI00384D203C